MSDQHGPIWQSRILGCSEIEDLLDEYFDGRLQGASLKSFQRHIDRCAKCRELVEDCGQIVSLARSLPERPLPEGAHRRLTQRLEAELGLRFAPSSQILRFTPNK